MPLKPRKDPTESFLMPKRVSGIGVESLSCGSLRQEDFGSPDLQLEGQVSSRGDYGLTNTKLQRAIKNGAGNPSL